MASEPPSVQGSSWIRYLAWTLVWSVIAAGIGPFAFARHSMGPWVSAAVCWHIAGGSLLIMSLLLLWKHKYIVCTNATIIADGYSGIGQRRSRVFLIVCAAASMASGVALVTVAGVGVSVGRAPTLLLVHIYAGLIGSAGLFALWLARHTAWSRIKGARLSPAAALLAVSGVSFAGVAYNSEGYYRNLTATTARQAANPLFPAGTVIAPPDGWKSDESSERCGAAGCHASAHKGWLNTTHARSANSPAYDTALRSATKSLGPEGTRWCAGCHAPTSLLQSKNSSNSGSSAIRGLDCLACHAMLSVPEYTGNGRALYSSPAAYPFAAAHGGLARMMHNYLIRVRPQPHSFTLSGPRSENGRSEMCAPCHRLSATAVQNHYRFSRFDNTWKEWQTSPSSGESIHSFQPARVRRDCVDCHNPHDAHDVRITASTNDRRMIRLEVFSLRSRPARGASEQIVAPLTNRPAIIAEGETVRLDILVENKNIGHDFPPGPHGLGNAWIELNVTDAHGQVRFVSHPEPAATSAHSDHNSGIVPPHRYGLLTLNRTGKIPSPSQFFEGIAPIYRRSISPGEVDVARFRFAAPTDAGGFIRIVARLVRPGRPGAGVQTVRRGEGTSDDVLAEHSVTIGVRGGKPGSISPLLLTGRKDEPVDAGKFRAYGGGLLNQRDLPLARRAFQQARSLAPNDPENWIGLGRVYLEDGDRLSAITQFNKALELRPKSPRATAWLGRVYRLKGQYETALSLLEPLAQQYPDDKLTWFDVGLSSLSMGRYEQAIDAFNRILEIDPDDVSAHYNLMQCYRRLRRIAEARREEGVFRVLRESDPPVQLVDPYLRIHPDARVEAQTIHEHVLVDIKKPGPSGRDRVTGSVK